MAKQLIQITQSQAGPNTTQEDGAAPEPSGVYLDAVSRLRVEIPVGAYPGRFYLDVSTAVDQQLRGFDPALPISIVGAGRAPGAGPWGGELTNFAYRNLWIAERQLAPNRNDTDAVRWIFEDSRRWLRSIRGLGVFNEQRIVNEFDELPGVDIDSNFGQFNRLPRVSYWTVTARTPGGNRFAGYDEGDVLEIWTAYQALRYMLTGFFDNDPGRVTLPNGQNFRPDVFFDGSDLDLDNKFPLSSFPMDAPWPKVVQGLLRRGQLGLCPRADGKWVVFRMKPEAFRRKIAEYTGGGHVIKPDRRYKRARRHRTIFKTRYDIRADVSISRTSPKVVAVESFDPGAPQVFPIQLDPVVITPFDLPDPRRDRGGLVIRRGTILKETTFIEAINLSQDEFLPASFLTEYPGGLTLDLVDRGVLSPQLAEALSIDRTISVGQRHPTGPAIAATFYDSHRRLFQIPQDILEFLRNIQARVGDVADNATGRVGPSRVYFDHCLILSAHGSIDPGLAPESGLGFSNQRPWPVGDANKLISAAQASDFAQLQVLDPSQGLFKIAPIAAVDGLVEGWVPYTFKKFPPDATTGISQEIPAYLSQVEADDEWRASWIFSAEIRTNALANHFFVESLPPAMTKAFGPEVEEKARGVRAAYPWNDATSKTEIADDGQIVLSGFNDGTGGIAANIPYNRGRLSSIAGGLASSYYFEEQDWIVGTYRAPGYLPDKDFPAGNFNIVITHNPATGIFETVFRCFKPESPPLFENLSRDAAALLYKLDDDVF